jgi:hypothetical protein
LFLVPSRRHETSDDVAESQRRLPRDGGEEEGEEVRGDTISKSVREFLERQAKKREFKIPAKVAVPRRRWKTNEATDGAAHISNTAR